MSRKPITHNKPGLGSNGEVQRKRDGLNLGCGGARIASHIVCREGAECICVPRSKNHTCPGEGWDGVQNRICVRWI
jgi:hypothetical protein